jgi:hypothetical protein
MKKFFNNLAWVLAIAFLLAVLCLRMQRQNNLAAIAEYRLQDSLKGVEIDALYKQLEASEGNVDTIYVELVKWRTRYDTIIEQIPTMPPDDQLALFDKYTGDHDHSLLTDTLPHAPCPMPHALIPMPRIEQALVLFTERDMLEGEIRMLTRVIKEQDGQIHTLKAIVEQKDGQLAIRDAWIETIGKENKNLVRRLQITQWAAGFVVFVLTVVAVSQ